MGEGVSSLDKTITQKRHVCFIDRHVPRISCLGCKKKSQEEEEEKEEEEKSEKKGIKITTLKPGKGM